MQTNDIKVLLCWINKKPEDSLILCQGDLTVLNIDKMLEPRSQADHGTMVLHCQPWSTMVDNDVTMVADHGASSGTWPWYIANHGQIGITQKTFTSSSSLLECCPVKCMLCFQETIFDVQMSGNEYNEIWGITWNNMIYHGLRNWAKITGTLTLLVWGMLWILAL